MVGFYDTTDFFRTITIMVIRKMDETGKSIRLLQFFRERMTKTNTRVAAVGIK